MVLDFALFPKSVHNVRTLHFVYWYLAISILQEP